MSRLILASSSPRRSQLLETLGWPFTVTQPLVEERQRPGEMVSDYVQRNAREKACWVGERLDTQEPTIILAADTVVTLDHLKALEKPTSEHDARAMLASLSGKVHWVYSGVSVMTYDKDGLQPFETFPTVTEVGFRNVDPQDIERYVATGEPMDKSGSYSIQGGACGFIEWIRGSHTSVMGLPLAEVCDLLRPMMGSLGSHERGEFVLHKKIGEAAQKV